MADQPTQQSLAPDLTTLLAGNVHEVKNLLAQLFLALDEAAITAQSDCPRLAQRLTCIHINKSGYCRKQVNITEC